jgi:HD-GYP domain-containing protein (c-di-GMP phosphodiesterase class II)
MIESAPDPPPSAVQELAMQRVAERLQGDVRLSLDGVTRPGPRLVAAWRTASLLEFGTTRALCVFFAPACSWREECESIAGFADRVAAGDALLVVVGRPTGESLSGALDRGLASFVDDLDGDALQLAALRAFELLECRARAEAGSRELARHRHELGGLLHIARAMTTVRDVDELLGIILEKSRLVTGADAGSIYIVEEHDGARVLRFKLTQNDSVSFDSREFTMPLSESSIAGCAALALAALNIPDVYRLPASSPFRFDPTFDLRTGYLTRSTLAVRLVSQREEVIGVIQLINKKRDPKRKLTSRQDVDDQVIEFDAHSEELLGMLAAQAGASLETALLYDEIRQLFDGLVGASVEAIESRDPTTSGHSRRVADLTLELARIVDRESTGPYAPTRFSSDDLRELRYAATLHDFGKIGVREKVLVKAKKLFDEHFDLVRSRFDYVARSIESDVFARKVGLLESGASRDELDALDQELARRRLSLDEAWEAIRLANEPSLMTGGDFARITEIARETYTDLHGRQRSLLEAHELESLSVRKGSLTVGELDEIRSHVSHTFRFLSRIPWGKALRRVPLIAAAHHERLDGAGYPNRLCADDIPVQSKIMSIADIYDALTAKDRPYKKAVPLERALDILRDSARDGHLDGVLVGLFIDGQVWRRTPTA